MPISRLRSSICCSSSTSSSNNRERWRGGISKPTAATRRHPPLTAGGMKPSRRAFICGKSTTARTRDNKNQHSGLLPTQGARWRGGATLLSVCRADFARRTGPHPDDPSPYETPPESNIPNRNIRQQTPQRAIQHFARNKKCKKIPGNHGSSRKSITFAPRKPSRCANAQVAELVDAHVSGACAARRAGSIPVLGTRDPVERKFDGVFIVGPLPAAPQRQSPLRSITPPPFYTDYGIAYPDYGFSRFKGRTHI